MAFDIITIEPTVSDGAHAAGDVFFNLTSFQIPARACKLVNIFMQVRNGGGEDDTKLGVLFFQKNEISTLGTLNATANQHSSGMGLNQYIGQAFLGLSDEGGGLDLDVIDSTSLYYPTSAFASAANAGAIGAVMDPIVLKGDAGSTELFAAGVVHVGGPDFDGTDRVKIHLHIEY
tara:strand:+ start:184 stop:708 length:525 start_codon:yes stop_codon:yes gene_type:complete